MSLLTNKDLLIGFGVGFIFSGLLFIWENSALKKHNKNLASSLANISALNNVLINLYGEKEGEK
ncbi:hypothetical protein [Clostridium sp.]|uniref:hypothetical protein n=1 Tax=Clostridium sp. TaxID=1506 RepID=UPI0026192FB4|nr:hypothetical protein [Clostridium sp.]